MINIGICDDIEQMRKMIKDMCIRYSRDNGISFSYKEFSSGMEVAEYDKPIDILFQDIVIPDMNGIDVMNKIRDKDNIELIIFVTGHSSYGNEVFSSKTRGFILKPIVYSEFEKNVKKVISELQRRKIIELQTGKQTVLIRNSDLIYIETMGNYLKLYCKNNAEYTIYGSMKHWSEKLEEYGIIRVSNCCMVNLEYISAWDTTLNIEWKNKQIQVGKSYYENGRKLFKSYMMRSLKELS